MVFEFDRDECMSIAKNRIKEMSGESERVFDRCMEVWEKIKDQVRIRAVITDECGVNEDTIEFNGVSIKCPVLLKFGDIFKIYAYALTVDDIEYEGSAFLKTVCDMWGTALCDAGCELLKDKIESINKGSRASEPVGPGFYGIDAGVIPDIFNGLNAGKIGISLENGFLKPQKSSIGFFILSDAVKAVDVSDCKSCSGDTNCIYCKNYKKAANIVFVNENKKITVPYGTKISDAIAMAGLGLIKPCGGRGICKKCTVEISHNGKSEKVLACSSRIYGDTDIILPERYNKINISHIMKKRGTVYGMAVDIGTTSVCMSILCDNDEIFSADTVNPQTVHSSDVIGRIEFARENTGILHNEITACINKMIALAKSELGIDGIRNAVITGNTVMLYLLQNENPKSLGAYPYEAALKGARTLKGSDIGIDISGTVYIPPNISAFVGADAVCGIASAGLWEHEGELLIDIGTNAEMAVFKGGRLYTASAAAGPAFEGGNITFGMGAYGGAVSRLDIINSVLSITTVGADEVKGICATGLVDAVSALLEQGIISGDGSFAKKEECMSRLRTRLCEYGGETAFMLSGNVYLTQSDIRAVQMAKSAVRSGIELMADGAEKIIISGAFGKNVRVESLVNIGMLPKRFLQNIKIMGNTAIEGAKMLYNDTDLRQKLDMTVSNCENISFADSPEFKKLFVKYMDFEEI